MSVVHSAGLPEEYFCDIPEINVDFFLKKLLSVNKDQNPTPNVDFQEADIKALILKTKHIVMEQDVLLELEAPMKICGDIHGQFCDLLRIFQYCGLPPESNYLFLGDYVDRGRQSLEVIILLFALKVKYPENFFLIRGNHECATINRSYGFYDECKKRYSIKLWKLFNDCFNCMPLCAVIDDKIFCTHGGLSPELRSLEQIRRVIRPTDIPDNGLLCDLVWSDPDTKAVTWAKSDRGVSQTFGVAILDHFLEENDFDMMVRAHQVVQEGYEFFAGARRCITVFSAPNYTGEFDNSGAIMNVTEDLVCSFQILKPQLETGSVEETVTVFSR